jgi:hypothetical protein
MDVKAGQLTAVDPIKVGQATLRAGDGVNIHAPAGLLRQARWLHP